MSFFICAECGYGSATFIGRCPECGQWNTLKQARGIEEKPGRTSKTLASFATTAFEDISVRDATSTRIPTHIHELDRVIGGGIVPGQVILLTGEPGIGKSTLLLQSLVKIRSLYISGEESAQQIKQRASRLEADLSTCVYSDTLQIEGIIAGVESMHPHPQVVVVDSLQMLYSKTLEGAPGSVTQLRECALQLVRMAKEKHIALILIGHVTKDGDVAGPKIVEHMVDTVLSFEGDKVSHFRILRSSKNRFATTDEIGIFEMTARGLAGVDNPMAFVTESADTAPVPGRCIAGVMEGKRPIFFEVQSLAVPTTLPVPRRVVAGLDYNKVLLLLAVIRRHMGMPLEGYDIYVNVAGGIEVDSPAADLAVIASIISSVKDNPVPNRAVFSGEVGLLGEVRKAVGLEKVSAEAKRIGLTVQYTPSTLRNCKELLKLFN